jgi:hypothetical protein
MEAKSWQFGGSGRRVQKERGREEGRREESGRERGGEESKDVKRNEPLQSFFASLVRNRGGNSAVQ